MMLRCGGKMKLVFMLALLPICIANECMEAVQDTCQQVITENNGQLLQTMEGMVANSTCDASNFVEAFKEEFRVELHSINY